MKAHKKVTLVAQVKEHTGAILEDGGVYVAVITKVDHRHDHIHLTVKAMPKPAQVMDETTEAATPNNESENE